MAEIDDRKTDVLEDLISAWTGEVGQLNIAVQKMPATFRASISEIEIEQKKLLGKMEGYSNKFGLYLNESFVFLGVHYDDLATKQQELKDLVAQNKQDNHINVGQIRTAVGRFINPVTQIADTVEKIEGIIGRSNELNSNSSDLLGGIEKSVGASMDAIEQFNGKYREFTEKNEDILDFIIQSASVAKSEKERNEGTRSGLREIDSAIDKLNFDYKIAAAAAAACFVVGFVAGKFL